MNYRPSRNTEFYCLGLWANIHLKAPIFDCFLALLARLPPILRKSNLILGFYVRVLRVGKGGFSDLRELYVSYLADLCSDLVPKITCQVGEPGLISRLWLRTPC